MLKYSANSLQCPLLSAQIQVLQVQLSVWLFFLCPCYYGLPSPYTIALNITKARKQWQEHDFQQTCKFFKCPPASVFDVLLMAHVSITGDLVSYNPDGFPSIQLLNLTFEQGNPILKIICTVLLRTTSSCVSLLNYFPKILVIRTILTYLLTCQVDFLSQTDIDSLALS